MTFSLARILAAMLLGVPALLAQQAPLQQPPPVFRVEVDAVEIDAFVTDGAGNPVTDLTVDDFEILEDGRPQTITALTLVNIPIEREERPLFSPTAIEPDVFTNTGPEGRLYVIALDEVPPQYALRTRHFMRRFLEQHFAANDVAAIVLVTRGRGADTQDFTSNRRLLLAAIERYSGGGLLAPEMGVRDRMRALRDLLEFMAKLRGRRKTMLYITAGVGEDVYGVLDYNGGVRSQAFDDLHAALTAATRGNVSIYPIDPAGLSPGGDLGEAEVASTVIPGAEIARTSDLRAIAQATGGFALVNSNSFDAAFTRIIRENSTYYVLGFTSTNDRSDGRYRRLQVRVKRPGLQVRARDGYVAPMQRRTTEPERRTRPTALAAAVGDALGMPIASRGLPMTMTAAPYKSRGRDANVAIVVELDPSRLTLVKGATIDGQVDIAVAAAGAGGKVFEGERHRLKLALKPGTYEAAQEHGFRVLVEMELPPGRYQLRAAAGDVTGTVAGSVMADLEVPDFTRPPLIMSGVALTSRSAAGVVTSEPKIVMRDVLPGPPTTRREFYRGDAITAYVEVYENARSRASHTVSLKTELRSDEGRVIHTVDQDRSSTELQGKSGGYGFRAELPLDLDPGIYVIHLEAQARIGDQPTVSRQIQIRVK